MTQNEPNMYDSVVDELHKRRELVRKELAENYRRVKPFREEPVSKGEMLYYYNQLTVEDMEYLVQKYGEEALNEFIYEQEAYKNKQKGRR